MAFPATVPGRLSAVAVAGLTTDFCVACSALDAARLGFRIRVVEDACRAIDLEGSLGARMGEMRDAGVAVVRSGEVVG